MNAQFRLILFVSWFALLVLWEVILPKINKSAHRKVRWTTNFLIIMTGQIVVRIFYAAGIFKVSDYFFQQGFGLFNWLGLNQQNHLWVTIVQLIILDFLIYLQHLISHLWRPIWRLHRVHHLEDFLDVSSALRFHPAEIAFSMLYKVFWLSVLAVPIEVFFVFEILLSSMAMFNHANISLPKIVDTILRKLIVTPDFHRVHHYAHTDYMHTNFGFNLSIWDYLFKTYKSDEDCPLSLDDMGMPGKPAKPHRFWWLLKIPFFKIN